MVSMEAITAILGINESVDLNLDQMVKKIKLTFYPNSENQSENIEKFSNDFKVSLNKLNVKILPFDSVWEVVPIKKRVLRFLKYSLNNFEWVRRKILGLPSINFYLPLRTLIKLSSKWKIKKGISVVCIGEQNTEDLVMQYISSFKTNSIITIVDLPDAVKDDSEFAVHFNTSMSLFAYHMTNIIIAVNKSKWITYNFNASHPSYIYPSDNMHLDILKSIVPKIAAPIAPHKLNEFIISDKRFDPFSPINKIAVSDMINGAKLFSKTNLFPDGKSIDSLPFRNNLHKLIGKLHLDNRSGMSFGYLAYQLPTKLPTVVDLNEFKKDFPNSFINGNDFYISNAGNIYISLFINEIITVIQIPEVWVMTIRSGANKTNFDPRKDLIKIGLVNGRMHMQLPTGLIQDNTYKPSFDTKVILALALCNALIAAKAKFLYVNTNFFRALQKKGVSISHWHGYFNSSMVPKGVIVYGKDNPHVSCSSPQSAVYAFQGKMSSIFENLSFLNDFVGDIHIEPHHGINVSYPSLIELAQYILKNDNCTSLGNKYLQ